MAQIHAQGAIADRDLVSQLSRKSFASRTVAEQKLIVQQHRPMPKLQLKTRGRVFQEEWYQRKDWLCGSEGMKGLFCWPCLLFRPGVSQTWTETGYTNMHGFLCDCKKHEKASAHLGAYKMWKTFDVTERVDVLFSRARREEVERHNEEVKQNREMLKTLSEAVLFLAKQELPFRGHDESSLSLNKGNYRELLALIGKFDSVFECRLRGRLAAFETGNAGVFTGVSADIQNDLIECIDSVIQDQIDKEIEDCTFLSIQIDETTDVSTKEQLSAIIRLDKKGEIVERFLKFADVSTDRTAPAITVIVKKVLSKYGDSLQNKLIMQTYDGATVMSGHIAGVQALVREEYPFAFFFHCAAHRLNLVLCQSASSISSVKVFFANVSAFSTFTSLSSKRKELFRSHNIEIPRPGETRWYYRSRTVRVIADKYEVLIDVLEGIVNNSQHWDDATLTQASGLLQYLNSFLFCFLVFVFGKILGQSSVLYDVLQNRSTDFSYGVGMITNFAEFLTDMRTDEAFHNTFESAVAIVGQPSSRSDRKHNYKQLYFQVIDNTVAMLNDRFADCKHFAFLDLVNPNFFARWKAEFPADKLQLLKSKYGPLFNIQLLQSQLLFIYRDNDFYKKSSVEVLNYLYEFGLQESLSEVAKLLKLNSAIAVSSASVERSFSCLRRVKTYLRNKMGQERLGSLCRISIHKDLLKELEDTKKLHDLIAEKFIEKPRRLNFLYK